MESKYLGFAHALHRYHPPPACHGTAVAVPGCRCLDCGQVRIDKEYA
ncbi:MAG: hypothetical protein NTY65_00185 [Planctomycetota bacterium]|nr:hypothetical protein [Planctomycetota bacterium]